MTLQPGPPRPPLAAALRESLLSILVLISTVTAYVIVYFNLAYRNWDTTSDIKPSAIISTIGAFAGICGTAHAAATLYGQHAFWFRRGGCTHKEYTWLYSHSPIGRLRYALASARTVALAVGSTTALGAGIAGQRIIQQSVGVGTYESVAEVEAPFGNPINSNVQLLSSLKTGLWESERSGTTGDPIWLRMRSTLQQTLANGPVGPINDHSLGPTETLVLGVPIPDNLTIVEASTSAIKINTTCALPEPFEVTCEQDISGACFMKSLLYDNLEWSTAVPMQISNTWFFGSWHVWNDTTRPLVGYYYIVHPRQAEMNSNYTGCEDCQTVNCIGTINIVDVTISSTPGNKSYTSKSPHSPSSGTNHDLLILLNNTLTDFTSTIDSTIRLLTTSSAFLAHPTEFPDPFSNFGDNQPPLPIFTTRFQTFLTSIVSSILHTDRQNIPIKAFSTFTKYQVERPLYLLGLALSAVSLVTIVGLKFLQGLHSRGVVGHPLLHAVWFRERLEEG
ncbi:hypothetical protein HK097_004808, partial [Rhizophlyctis rosea]